MKSVVQIRAGRFPPTSDDELKAIALSQSSLITPPGPSNLPSHLRRPLTRGVPVPLLRKFVALAAKIHAIAHRCIESCLRRVTSAMGTSVETWPWLVEQRAIISLWRMQFFFEVKNKLPSYLRSYDTVESFFNWGRFIDEQVLTMAECVNELRATIRPFELGPSEGVSSHPSHQYSFPALDMIARCSTSQGQVSTEVPGLGISLV